MILTLTTAAYVYNQAPGVHRVHIYSMCSCANLANRAIYL